MSWKLKRTTQCAKCPWRKDVNPFDIPNEYDIEKHRGLANTIAKGDVFAQLAEPVLRIMQCHELEQAHCIGWLVNQMGPGHNLKLRLALHSCSNLHKVRTVGEQHATFEDTLP